MSIFGRNEVEIRETIARLIVMATFGVLIVFIIQQLPMPYGPAG
jgi:hypothetical protein